MEGAINGRVSDHCAIAVFHSPQYHRFMEAYEFIEGYTEVVAHFGVWPSFHDGEVHRIVLDRMRRDSSGAHVPSLEIDVRGWIMGPEVTKKGYYVLHHDAVVSFLFEDIFDLELEGFSQQNVLSSRDLSLSEGPTGTGKVLHVELEHCYLFAGEFSARKASVVGVRSWNGDAV
jgi:hypothetical protein